MEALPHLLVLGWHIDGTGFTRVLRELVPIFARHFRVTWIGVGYHGAPRDLMPGVRLEPTTADGGDLVGAYQTRLQWERLAPDALFALNDAWYLDHYSRELGARLGSIPSVGYLPLDGDIDDARIVEELTGFTSLFTYTRHAAGELSRALRTCGIGTPVGVAGHGVNVSAFRPAAVARDVFHLNEPSWVVLNASRPDPRKRIDITIEGFAEFVRGRPSNVYLCLHHAVGHPRFVEPLRQQAAALGLADRVLWWPRGERPLDDAELCALYNACAVGVNTSVGEGFGLVSFEHAATGAPQLVPAHPALVELWGDAAVLLGPVRRTRTDHSPLIMGEVTPGQVSDALGRLYSDAVEYRRLSDAAIERCRRTDVRWEPVAATLLNALGVSARAAADRSPDSAPA